MLKDKLRELFNNPLYIRYQIFIWPVVSVAVCLTLIGLVIYPQVLAYFNNRKLLSEIVIKQGVLTKKISSLEQINSDIFKKNIEVALLALPTDRDIPGVVGQMLYLLNINRLTLNEMSFSNSSNQGNQSDSFFLKIDVSGAKADYKNFISSINSIPRIVKVSGLEISTSRDGDLVQASMTLQVYYEALPTSIAQIDSPLPIISPKETEILSKIQSLSLVLPQSSVSTSSGAVNKGKVDPFK